MEALLVSDTLRVPSPDEMHVAELQIAGEVRFGPHYYSLRIDGDELGERVFGEACLWSPDSRFLAVHEWLTTSEAEGPKTALVLFDLAEDREVQISWANKGFIAATSFEGDKILYSKWYKGRGVIREFEMEFLTLDRWEPRKR
jgi:hypothetical protein